MQSSYSLERAHTRTPHKMRLTFRITAAAVVADDVAVDAVLVAAVRVEVADVEVACFGFLSAAATAGTV